jgi:DNA-binding LytR/AlgR family response regulator
MKLSCLIVDDEPIARAGLEEYVREIDFLHLHGQCESAVKASSVLQQHRIDLLLLDIQMPKLSGIDFLKTLAHPPMVILTTAYSEFALQGFELDCIDYLVKPIPYDRFLKAVQKARDFHQLKYPAQVQAAADYFFVKCDHKFEKVRHAEVLFVEALQNYVILHTSHRKLITYLTLTGVENQLPSEAFMKVHKSFLVALDKIESVEGNEICIGPHRIPVSRALKDEVMHRILGNNLLSR